MFFVENVANERWLAFVVYITTSAANVLTFFSPNGSPFKGEHCYKIILKEGRGLHKEELWKKHFLKNIKPPKRIKNRYFVLFALTCGRSLVLLVEAD